MTKTATKKPTTKKTTTSTTRPRATDGEIARYVRREKEPRNQPIVDALRARGMGASFGRVDRIRRSLKRAQKAA